MEQRHVDPADWVFVDEFGINLEMVRRYARAPRGERAIGSVPVRSGGNITLVFGLTRKGVIAPRMFFGAMGTEDFVHYAEVALGPELSPGMTVSFDCLSAHRSARVREAIERRGARVRLLPPYSPDLTPIENCGSKVKEALRAAAARSWDALVDAAATALRSVTPDDVYGWLKRAGFRPKRE